MQNEQSTRAHSLDGLAANSDLVWTCRDRRKAVKLVVVASPHDHGQIATRLQCNIRLAYSQAAWPDRRRAFSPAFTKSRPRIAGRRGSILALFFRPGRRWGL